MSIPCTKYRVTLTLTEPALGTVPLNPDVYRSYIESLKPEEQQEDEFKTVESKEERGHTGFHREPDEIALAPIEPSPTARRINSKPAEVLKTVPTKLGRLFTYDYSVDSCPLVA